MRILQINTTVNSGSTGRITEDIGTVLIANGHESYIAYGRGDQKSNSNLIKIGSKFDFAIHALITRLFDRHGFGSRKATKNLINEIEIIKPDAIGLHNLHGYYLNIEVLFEYLKLKNIPVLWTLFDCWAFTGHCTYFDDIQCVKYQRHCHKCPKINKYPNSFVIDNSFKNYSDKKNLFTNLERIEFVVHSNWLSGMFKKSFLKNYPVNCLPSGIDLDLFKPTSSNIKEIWNLKEEKIVLGVASIWDERKGLADFIELSTVLSMDYKIILIGLSKMQMKVIPENIIGIERTESVEELAIYYSLATVFVNPTYQDNFPTTNIEALACGTPVITYNTGGSPEAIDEETGEVVPKGNNKALQEAIIKWCAKKNQDEVQRRCRERAVQLFNKDDRYLEYLHLYEQIIKVNKFQ